MSWALERSCVEAFREGMAEDLIVWNQEQCKQLERCTSCRACQKACV